MATKILGPSKLSKVLAHLNSKPRLNLVGVKGLKLTYAYRNDHFGARHFAKEDLPRIRWANPTIDIEVEKVLKTAEEAWKPELEVHFKDGKSETFNLQDKQSSAIVHELMDTAGGDKWQAYKAEAILSGQPILPSASSTPPSSASTTSSTTSAAAELPSYKNFRELNPVKPAEAKKAAQAPIPEPPSVGSETTAPAS